MKNTVEQIKEIIESAEERNLTHFQASVIDSVGRLFGKRYHVNNLEKAMTEGIAVLEIATAGLDPAGGGIRTNRFINPVRGFADALAVMDASSVRDVPFRSNGNGLLLLGQFVDHMAELCPRALLDAELARLEKLGYGAYGGFELECTPLDESAASLQSKSPDSVQVRSGFDRVYSFVHESYQEDLYSDLLSTAAAMGVAVDSAHTEFLNIIEVALQPQAGMRIADNAALYKALAKIVGKRHNTLISFMARLNNSGQGCGAHINLSLRSMLTDEGVFFDAAADRQMSDTHLHFIGGLQRFMPAFFLLIAPNLNSYKRFMPNLFTPLNNSWGINNKTVAFRAINMSPGTARVEARVAGADVNPYLGLLAVLIAGRLGLEQKIEPPPAIEGNGWSADNDDNPFPMTFADAIEKFKTSAIVREQLGGQFVDVFASDRQWQLDQFNQSVTDWELRMFYDS